MKLERILKGKKMKSFEQIAEAMYEAHLMAFNELMPLALKEGSSWACMEERFKGCWIAAAKAAHKEITEVH